MVPMAKKVEEALMTDDPKLREDEKLVNSLAENDIMFVGRSLSPEYITMFELDLTALQGKRILDVAAGPASFTCEMCAMGFDVTAADKLYTYSPQDILTIAQRELTAAMSQYEEDCFQVNGEPVSWLVDNPLPEINAPSKMLKIRQESIRLFIDDYEADQNRAQKRYLPLELPDTAILGSQLYDVILLGNLLFAYSNNEGYGYDFHLSTIRALASHLRPEGEIRVYPFGDENAFDFPFETLFEDLANVGIRSKVQESRHRFVKGWVKTLLLYK